MRTSLYVFIVGKYPSPQKMRFESIRETRSFLRSEGLAFADSIFTDFGSDEELTFRHNNILYRIQVAEKRIERKKI